MSTQTPILTLRSRLRRRARYFFLRLRRASPDRIIELIFALVIVIFTIMQYGNTKANNSSTTQQTDQLIAAGKYSAYAANQNAQASRSFAESASAISKGVDDAVSRLQAQALATELASESSNLNARRALDAAIDTAHQQQRAWIGIDEVIPFLLHRDAAAQVLQLTATLRLQNHGRSAAEHILVRSYLSADVRNIGSSPQCERQSKPDYVGDVIYPDEKHSTRITVEIKTSEMVEALRSQNPQLGRVSLLRLQGCVTYQDRPHEKPQHDTPFSFFVIQKNGSISPETANVPGDDLSIQANFLGTGDVK